MVIYITPSVSYCLLLYCHVLFIHVSSQCLYMDLIAFMMLYILCNQIWLILKFITQILHLRCPFICFQKKYAFFFKCCIMLFYIVLLNILFLHLFLFLLFYSSFSCSPHHPLIFFPPPSYFVFLHFLLISLSSSFTPIFPQDSSSSLATIM